MPLPLKEPNTKLPNNRDIAFHHLKQPKRRFASDEKYQNDYVAFMNTIIQRGYAEKVSKVYEDENENNQQVWYIPHHRVYHLRSQTR